MIDYYAAIKNLKIILLKKKKKTPIYPSSKFKH